MHAAIKYAEQICYSSKEVLHFTYDMAKKYVNVPGAYCEAGVAAGAQIIALAAGGPNKTIYAFDSFEGISLPSNRDNQYPGIRMISKEEQAALPDPGKQLLESSGATVVSLEDFTNHLDKAIGIDYILDHGHRSINLSNNATVITVKGWFEETMPNEADKLRFLPGEGINILRLDSDLYNSTYVSLKYLYPRVLHGSCVIIDDWQLPGCRAACDDYFNSINENPAYQFIDNIAYFIV